MKRINNIFNIFNINLFKIFKNKNNKIFPIQNIRNRRRSQTDYNIETYKNTLQIDFTNKIENKHNKKYNSLRIRGSSF